MYAIGYFDNIILIAEINDPQYFPLHAYYDTVYAWHNCPSFAENLSTLADIPTQMMLWDSDLEILQDSIVEYYVDNTESYMTFYDILTAIDYLKYMNNPVDIFRYHFDFPLELITDDLLD